MTYLDKVNEQIRLDKRDVERGKIPCREFCVLLADTANARYGWYLSWTMAGYLALLEVLPDFRFAVSEFPKAMFRRLDQLSPYENREFGHLKKQHLEERRILLEKEFKESGFPTIEELILWIMGN